MMMDGMSIVRTPEHLPLAPQHTYSSSAAPVINASESAPPALSYEEALRILKTQTADERLIGRIKSAFQNPISCSGHLDLSDLDLTSLPDALEDILWSIPSSITFINLAGNALHYLPVWLFELSAPNRPQLEIGLARLPLSDRMIKHIHARQLAHGYTGPIFSHLPDQGADFVRTRQDLHEDLRLWVVENPTSSIRHQRKRLAEELHPNLASEVNELVLKIDQVDQLPKELAYFEHLNFLAIENPLSSMKPHDFLDEFLPHLPKLSSLKSLVISNISLRTFPREILELPQLKYLALRKCQLEELPNDIDRLANLEYLSFRGNALQAVPSSIGRLPKLHDLILGKNPLLTLPSGLEGIPYLFYGNQSGPTQPLATSETQHYER